MRNQVFFIATLKRPFVEQRVPIGNSY